MYTRNMVLFNHRAHDSFGKLAMKVWWILIFMLPPQAFANDPFDTCPAKAFLMQGNNASLYSVNLVSGNSELLSSSLGTSQAINAFGFNLFDRYLYGFGKESSTVVKIGKNYQAQTLNIINMPDMNFFVGDVAVTENALYLYRKASTGGLYRIALDSTDADYLTAVLLTGTNGWNLNIYDMAFHPSSGKLYAVESDGDLYEINVTAKTATLMNNIGVSGTFGAQYFDPEGNLYLGRNNDGHIYRVNIDNIQNGTNLVSQGPFSPAVNGTTYTYDNFPSNTNINGTSNNDLLIINGNLLGTGVNYNGNSGYDRLVLGNAASYYTVVSQGTGAYRITWPNGRYLNLNGVEEILYGNVGAANTTAELFTVGPISTQNDGARCATAAIIDEDIYDFGDAPSAYGTTITDNGARHEVGDLYLGGGVSTETVPRASDTQDDGISFITNTERASNNTLNSIIVVTASKAGYLHAWVDWDQNQTFATTEKVLDGYSVSAGTNTVVISVPSTASLGSTWSRFRLSESQTENVTGGSVNGEVEDYQITVIDSGYSTTCYPSISGFVTLAYEDIWPRLGDYDFNDVVVRYRSCIDQVGSTVKRFSITGKLVSVGAFYHNAFAVRLEGVSPSTINTSKTTHVLNGEFLTSSPVESGRSETILTVIPDTKTVGNIPTGCTFFRTESGCDSSNVVTFDLSVTLGTGINEASAPSGRFDPFIYAVDGYDHGEDVSSDNERGWEVHLKNQAPTEAFNTALYGVAMDASDASQGIYFQTAQGHPFAIEISTSWRPPREKTSINEAYSRFIPFAESNGSSDTSWFNTMDSAKIINEDN